MACNCTFFIIQLLFQIIRLLQNSALLSVFFWPNGIYNPFAFLILIPLLILVLFWFDLFKNYLLSNFSLLYRCRFFQQFYYSYNLDVFCATFVNLFCTLLVTYSIFLKNSTSWNSTQNFQFSNHTNRFLFVKDFQFSM